MNSKEYNQLLKFLYFEGYAESYKDAENLIEEMSDDEFGDLYEEVIVEQNIINYLLDEGYADSVESAEVILDNMSDDWLDSILDEAKVKLSQPKRAAMGRKIAKNLERTNQLSNMLASPHAQERPDVAKKVEARRNDAWRKVTNIRGALKAAQRKNNP